MGLFPDRIGRLPVFEGAFPARRLTADGCDVLFASYPAEQRLAVHHHAAECVGIVTHGELLLTLHGVERAYRPGQWFHIPAGAPHAARFAIATALIEFWFRDYGG
jgi:quercetin dioxygenase-like cupin family protein